MKEAAYGVWMLLVGALWYAYRLGMRGYPTQADEEVAFGIALVAVVVLVPLGIVLSLLAYRRRIGERLGVLPPGSGRRPDEDLGA